MKMLWQERRLVRRGVVEGWGRQEGRTLQKGGGRGYKCVGNRLQMRRYVCMVVDSGLQMSRYLCTVLGSGLQMGR